MRAEVAYAGQRETTCAIEMTAESIFVISETLPPVGDIVVLELSFPRMLRPLVVTATIKQIRMAGGPGSPPGFVATFEPEDQVQSERIGEIAKRVRTKTQLANCSLRVLLVEDNKLIRDTFAYAFERYFKQRAARIDLTQAATADEAWALARPDTNLVLVDHTLQGEPGTKFVARLRSDEKLGRAFIVGMSGGGRHARDEMLAAGADLFLAKPIVLKDLFSTLELLTAPAWSEYGAA